MAQFAHVSGALPGPRSVDLLAKKEEWISAALAPQVPAVIEAAHGCILTDVDGNRFIDLASGIGVAIVGHGHPAVVRAINEQVQRLIHANMSVVSYPPVIELAELLCERTPVRRPRRAAFFNSGAEAVENAVKIARCVTGRQAVISFEGAFHGRTYMAMSLTSRVRPYKVGFGPFQPEVYRLPYPYPYRLPGVTTPAGAVDYCLRLLEEAFSNMVDPGQVAAIVVEPVLGEGGFVPAPPGFLQGLRQVATRQGIVLVVDEIQTGYGRTGKFFAIEHSGVEPDIITVGKGIANGLPLSAVIGSADLMDAVQPGGIGGTYGGNPVACAAGVAVLDVIRQEHLVERAELLGEIYLSRFAQWAERFEWVGEVRGLGAMCALEIIRDHSGKEPDAERVGRVLARAVRRGVVLISAGVFGNVIRMLAPLVISEPELHEALDLLEDALAEESAAS